jgi:cytochrome c553
VALVAAAQILVPTPVLAGDTGRGKAIYQAECVNCHGPAGWGGRDGEYPRLAGMPASYLQLQLAAFRDRKRQNKPMIPIFKSGRLGTSEIAAVAAYLSDLPAPEPNAVEVPEHPDYDREWGEELYTEGCSLCHGADGNGKPDTENPPLTRQYPAYLIKQIRDFRSGKRWHEYAEALFQEAEPDELEAMLGYMLDLNRNPPPPAETTP